MSTLADSELAAPHRAPADSGQAFEDALACAALLAIDPAGLGGIVLRSGHGPHRQAWQAHLERLLPASVPRRRLPLNASDAALIGGLDLAATLQRGQPVMQPGVLAQCDGGVVTMAMAERTTPMVAARIASVIDRGEVAIERDGLARRAAARVGLVALDEGLDDDEQLPAALRERLAFRLDEAGLRGLADLDLEAQDVSQARERLPHVRADDAIVQALCGAALALGVDSSRAPILALRAARAAAALEGRDEVDAQDAALAARLVFSHRATRLPAAASSDAESRDDPPQDAPPEPPTPDDVPPLDSQAQSPQEQDPPAPPPNAPPPDGTDPEDPAPPQDLLDPKALQEQLVDAARAAIPAGLLALIGLGQRARASASSGGRAGALQKGLLRGRPVGTRRGEPRGGARLHVLETLRSAAPWQTLRARQAAGALMQGVTARAETPPASVPSSPPPAPARRIHVRREDFHLVRFKQHSASTAIFVVDASGSSALHRLAEAKGAVELLLADCYVRRDRVALLAFRGQQAEMLLPPTRSLARAKRSLSALPGGGGTPLACALDAARGLAESVRRAGDTPVIVMLTDGRANIARDGTPGRARATEDALASASALRTLGASALLLDTSPQPQAGARELASRMGATYLPLPHADAQAMSTAVRLATGR